MDEHKDKQISRRGFLSKASAGLLTFGLFRGERFRLSEPAQDKQAVPEYRQLGRTGIRVTPVGFGASRTMEPMLLRNALKAGINFIDTGRSYFNGQNEVMVGKVIKGIREEVIVQSKIKIKLQGIGKNLDSTEVYDRITNLTQSLLAESLKALQTDYIDVLLFHEADSVDMINHDAVVDFFRDAKEKGQIRACGFSTHSNQVELLKAANKSKSYDVVMVPYNHKGSYMHMLSDNYREWDQPALEKELEKAEQNNIGIVAMKTCSGGPYAFKGEDQPSYRSALKWILNHSYINTMAVAMGNLSELSEDLQAIS
ncbi:MAG: aldo/keto reductase [Fidelibacterota bacterium]|nr:MAG: aldo/keto reductase [Candidatus Neomarinimicrobiota bacterium]